MKSASKPQEIGDNLKLAVQLGLTVGRELDSEKKAHEATKAQLIAERESNVRAKDTAFALQSKIIELLEWKVTAVSRDGNWE